MPTSTSTRPRPKARPRPSPTTKRHPRRVVVTAGPTREHLDDVRFLTNASTGRMGIAIARAARRRRAEVVLVLGPSSLRRPSGVEVVDVETTEEMLRATRKAARGSDLVVFAAAPCDWRPVRRRRGKPPRADGDWDLHLRPTRDIAVALARNKGDRVHVGFALEVSGGAARARAKLERKAFDAIVLNGPENLGVGGGRVRWIPRTGSPETLPAGSKDRLGSAIVRRAWDLLEAP